MCLISADVKFIKLLSGAVLLMIDNYTFNGIRRFGIGRMMTYKCSSAFRGGCKAKAKIIQGRDRIILSDFIGNHNHAPPKFVINKDNNYIKL